MPKVRIGYITARPVQDGDIIVISEGYPQVTFITRKAPQIEELKRALRRRRAEFVERINWLGLDGVSEIDYVREIRRSRLFLNLSPAEGLPCSLLEAMRAGTVSRRLQQRRRTA